MTFTRTTATLNAYTGGQLTWNDGTHDVRIPIVVRPVALAAPAQVSGTGGPINYDVTFGYTGAFTATARGLIPAVITADTVLDDPTNSTCSLASPNAKLFPVVVPAGTTYARFSLFDADVNPGSDIDLCVFNSGEHVGWLEWQRHRGRGGQSRQSCRRTRTPSSCRAGASTSLRRSSCMRGCWAVPMPATWRCPLPASATIGATAPINLTFSGLAAGNEIPGLGRVRRNRRIAEPDHRPGRHAVTRHASDVIDRGLRAAVFLCAGFGEKEETTDSGRASPLR